jgi:hypothetical protein
LGLTQRQTEFLNCIVDHYNREVFPVHYSDVAGWMGVCKWTAYDMLRRLELKGYLESYYDVSVKGAPGRTQVLFKPSAKLLQKYLELGNLPCADWPTWREKLMQIFAEYKSGALLINELVALLPQAQGPTMGCACLIAVFVACLKTFNEQAIKLVQYININKPEQRLTHFSGTVAGSLSRETQTSGHFLEKEGMLTRLLERFHNSLGQIELGQYNLLVCFLDDLIQAAA